MVAKMNAGSLSAVITIDIEDLGIALGNALGRLFTNCAHESRPRRGWTLEDKGLLHKAIEVGIVECSGSMGLLQIAAVGILALKMADTS